MSSSGHSAAAQRSAGGAEECPAEQSGDAQGTRRESVGGGSGLEEVFPGVVLPSQSMQVNGAQGNQTRSLPVSRKSVTGLAAESGPTESDSV
jgi:hypothetical protein